MKAKAIKRNCMAIMILFMTLIFHLPVSAYGKKVAKVGGNYYSSVEQAVLSASSGQTVRILSNVVSNKCLNISKKVTIDFGGKKYSYKGKEKAFQISGENVFFKNGNIVSSSYIAQVEDGATLTVSGKSGKYEGSWRNEGTLKIIEGNFTGKKNNIFLNRKGSLQIKNGRFKCYRNEKAVVMNTDGGKCAIHNGNFWGIDNAVYNKQGVMTIKKGYFSSENCNTICNYSKLTIGGGRFEKERNGYSLIYNYSNLKIQDGNFNGDICNKISGTGSLQIDGGFFTCDYANIIDNRKGLAEIRGGTYYTPNNNTVINHDEGKLIVSRGAFKSGDVYYTLLNYGEAVLKGGSFIVERGQSAIYQISGSLSISDAVMKTGDVVYSSS